MKNWKGIRKMEFCHENLTKKKTESPKGIAPLHQMGALTTELLVEWSLRNTNDCSGDTECPFNEYKEKRAFLSKEIIWCIDYVNYTNSHHMNFGAVP